MMLMVSDNLKLGLFTEHIPIKDVVKELTVNRVSQKNKNVKADFN